MSQRYLITLGARTTVGGKVISASSNRSINGVKVAVEDDKVMCAACRSLGTIKLSGPHLTELSNGKHVALQDDLCLCKCASPPRLIAVQSLVSQCLDAELHAAEIEKARTEVKSDTATKQSDLNPTDDVPLLLLHPDTHEPFRFRRYKLDLKDRIVEGKTDENGATRPLSASERSTLLAWHIDE